MDMEQMRVSTAVGFYFITGFFVMKWHQWLETSHHIVRACIWVDDY